MALSSTTITITDASDATYAFTFDWLRAAHISATINGTAVPAGQFAITGSSGAGVLTLSGAALTNLVVNDSLIILKTTPTAFDDRTVDFSDEGNVSLSGLDDAILHTISMVQDISDDVDDSIKISSSFSNNFNAQALQIQNLATGTRADSAVTLAQLQAVETESGALPTVDTSFNDQFLVVAAGSWGSLTPKLSRIALGLGAAAEREVDATIALGLLDRELLDARYFQLSNNLSEGTDATVRTNIGLGTAAVEAAGTTANTLLKLDGSGNIPAGVGVDSGVNLAGTSVYHKSGGFRDMIGIVRFVTASVFVVDNAGVDADDYYDDATNNLPVSAISGEYRNSGPTELTIDTGTDTINLTAGTWEFDLELLVKNEGSGGTAIELRAAIVDTYGADTRIVGMVDSSLNRLASDDSDIGAFMLIKLRDIYTFAGGAREFAVRCASATGGAMTLVDGWLRVRQLSL